MSVTISRCPWAKQQLDIIYHDTEWGVPVYNDNKLFEFIILESAQAGLSWSTILKKRSAYKEAYNEFQPELVAAYDSHYQNHLIQNAGIVRNRLKIEASINNAKIFLNIQQQHNSFNNYLWNFTDGKILQNHRNSLSDIPSSTTLSDQISKDLKSRGFKFFGSTTCYAFLQAVGIVNDHLTSCFRYHEL
ncbi:MAG: DNA-3-methyladenine glycosylase I [Rickettsia endosymbiont of Bryobia graminum]|nr:DNA-3-methyladenine glycosylase I [Rickettsia endosymbiont of Bryobia graminum]